MQWEVPLLSEWLQVGAYWTWTVSRELVHLTFQYSLPDLIKHVPAAENLHKYNQKP